MIRTFGSSLIDEQIVNDIAGDLTLDTPVIRQTDLVHCASVNLQGPHAGRYQHARFDCRPRCDDRSPAAMLQSNLRRQFRRNFGEQFGLQFAQDEIGVRDIPPAV